MCRQDRDRLGIRVGSKDMAELLEFVPQGLEILDDAVVDNRDLVGSDRVGVGLARAAVGSPSGVTDADQPLHGLMVEPPREVCKLAFGTAGFDAAIDQSCDPSGIIAAVFKPAQPSEQARSDHLL